MAMITLTADEKEKFNKYFPEQYQRNVAMSIFASIKYWQDKEIGFLRYSLDKLYKKYKNKFFLTLSNFKKIANKLEDLGFLRAKRCGRLKFYGTSDCKSDNEIRKENEELKEKNEALNEELERVKKELEEFKREVRENLKNISNSESEEIVTEKVENKNYDEEVIPQDEAIEMTCQIMKEVGIKKGSTVFSQVIESMYEKTNKEPLYKKWVRNYIEKVILNKVHNQSKFKGMLIAERKKIKPLKFNNFKGRDYTVKQMEELERKLLGWD